MAKEYKIDKAAYLLTSAIKLNIATPADWKDGEDVIVMGSIKTEDIPAKFPKGHQVIKPYLRTTPQPNK